MSSSTNDCPYHSKQWRSLIQRTINILRQEKLIQGRHCRVFPRLVCTCPDKVSTQFSAPVISKETIVEWYSTRVSSSRPLLKEVISTLYTAATSKDSNLFKVLNVVYLVHNGKTNCFDPPPSPTKDTSTEPTPVTIMETPKEERVFYLDIPVTPTQYIGTLIGTNGVHLKKLCETYGILNIHLGETPTESSDRKRGRVRRPKIKFLYSSPVKITYQYEPTNERGELFQGALEKRAAMIKEKREKHFQIVQEFYKAREERYKEYRERRARVQERRAVDENVLSDLFDMKLVAKGNYTSSKHEKNKKKDQQKREKPAPILTDSHCLHCMMSYSPGSVCTYHPGYVVDKKRKKKTFKAWSCCNSNYRKDNTLHENHMKTGCSTGQHIWRPHTTKKTKGSSGPGLVGDVDDIVLQANHKE